MKQSSVGSPGSGRLLRAPHPRPSHGPGTLSAGLGAHPHTQCLGQRPAEPYFPGSEIIYRGKPTYRRRLRTRAATLLCLLHLTPGVLRGLHFFFFLDTRIHASPLLPSSYAGRLQTRRGLRCPLLPTAASLALPRLKASQAHWSWDCQF